MRFLPVKKWEGGVLMPDMLLPMKYFYFNKLKGLFSICLDI